MADKIESAPPLGHFFGNAFVKQYYNVLQQRPQNLHLFYTTSSRIIRAQAGEYILAEAIASREEVITKVMTSISGWKAEVTRVTSQESPPGGILVVVTGYFSGQKSGRKKFVQTSLLTPKGCVYYVMNDMLRFVDAVRNGDSLTSSCSQRLDDEKDFSSSNVQHVPQNNIDAVSSQQYLKENSGLEDLPPPELTVARKPVAFQHPVEPLRYCKAESNGSPEPLQLSQQSVEVMDVLQEHIESAETNDHDFVTWPGAFRDFSGALIMRTAASDSVLKQNLKPEADVETEAETPMLTSCGRLHREHSQHCRSIC